MPLDAQDRFYPNTSPKQNVLRELCKKYRFPLANGPRYSGKTVGCEHAFCEHGWNTPRGNDCIITISQTVGMDSGIWKEFTEVVIPEWIDGDFGLKWVREPYVMGVSKKPTCEITNRTVLNLPGWESLSYSELKRAGAVSTFQLESLQVEDDAEDRFKPRKYTGIYVPELTTFKKRDTFNTWTECLRLTNPPPGVHFLFLADTNPPDQSSWWIHDLWWSLMELGDGDEEILLFLRESLKDFPEERLKNLINPTRVLKSQLARVDITVKDNPFADPEHVAILEAKYAPNEELYRRYILGECVQTTEDSLFYKVFRPGFHCIGDFITVANPSPEVMLPESDCIQLYTGIDPGVTNCASVVVEKFFPDEKLYPQYKGKPCFKILDELVVTGSDFDLNDYIETLVKKMWQWEEYAGRRNKMQWKHWGDRSVFDMKVAFTDRIWQEEILRVSGGIINIFAAERGKGSVNQRIDLFRRLLYEDRIFFNKALCPRGIEMCKALRKGKTQAGGIAPGDPNKHVFDALTYILASECANEIRKSNLMNLQKSRRGKNESGLITISV